MADISTWSPTDESNTAAPPAGWPENMQPSAVNNSARGMMGAIRRWYDTVTAQLASLTTALGNYLPLSGGRMTGLLTSSTAIIADGDITAGGNLHAGSDIYINGTGLHFVGSTTTGPYIQGSNTGWAVRAGTGNGLLQFADATNAVHANINFATGDFTTLGNLLPNNIYLSGDSIHFAGATTVGPYLQGTNAGWAVRAGSGNGLFQFADFANNVHLTVNLADGSLIAQNAIASEGTNAAFGFHDRSNNALIWTLYANAGSTRIYGNGADRLTLDGNGNFTVTGNITAPAFIGNVTVPAGGPVSTGGTVTGGQVTSTGNITATGGITAGSSVTSTGGFYTTDANGGNSFVIYSPPGANASFIQFLVGWYLHFNAAGGALSWFADSNLFWMMRYADHTCLNNLGPVAGVGAYINTSDRRGKKNIAPSTRGLAEIVELTPVEFDRISPVETPREIGFIAQDVKDVMPEAVRVVGITLPDGTGGLEDAEPSLGITDSTIVAALVNAVKELNARVVTLEGAG